MERRRELEKLKRRLPTPLDLMEEETLGDLFDDCLALALSKSNRTEPVPALLAIVREAALSQWNQRGDEGMIGSGAGGQSFSYVDLGERMENEILRANLRVFRR